MAVTKADKQAELQLLEGMFHGADAAILIDYKGINVPQVTELRRELKKASASYKVVKNTLAKRALKGTSFETLSTHFEGLRHDRRQQQAAERRQREKHEQQENRDFIASVSENKLQRYNSEFVCAVVGLNPSFSVHQRAEQGPLIIPLTKTEWNDTAAKKPRIEQPVNIDADKSTQPKERSLEQEAVDAILQGKRR